MATQTQQSPAERREQTIAAYQALMVDHAAAMQAGDKKAAASATGKMANRSREIRELELDLATEGVEFTPWTKPGRNGNGSSAPTVSQEQIQADLAKMAKVLTGEFPETVKHTADQRIVALLRQAEKAGYQVQDPRKRSRTAK